MDLEDEEQRDEPDGSTKPKRKPKAPPKTQATTGAKLPQNAEKVKKSSRESKFYFYKLWMESLEEGRPDPDCETSS